MSEKAAQAKGKQQQQKGKGKQPTADHQHTDKPTAGGKAKQPQGGDRALSNSGSNGQQSRQPKAASPSVTRPEASSSSLAPSSSSSPQGAAAAAVGGGAAPTAAGNKGAAKAPRAEKEKGSGIVKAVLSGDKIEVYVDEPAKRTAWVPPPIKELKLSNVKAPLPYAKGDWGVREEEPFAWASRNFLRELCIGKKVTWTIDGKDASGRREYATVCLQGESKSLAEMVVEAGYAEVSLPSYAPKTPVGGDAEGTDKKERHLNEALQRLVDAEDEAKKLERGKWTTAQQELKRAVPHYSPDAKAVEFYTLKKGHKLQAIIETVLSGSMMRALLLPDYREITIRVAGALSPATRKGKREEEAEPFAKEAQWTTERYALHRAVSLTFTAFEPGKEADEKRPTMQAIYHAEVELAGKSIGELLLASGLAKVVDWTIPKDKQELYRKLEAQAQAQKVRMWSSFTPAARAHESGADRSFLGTVKEVSSGSTIVVLNESVAPPTVVRVTMSSIDVPKMGVGEQPDEPYAFEAREFVRHKLIGRKAQITLDYVRPGKPADDKNKALPDKAFYTVSYKGKNIALALVEHGLAKVMEHFGQQQRSPHYDALFLAQQRAQKKNIGVHGPIQNKHYTHDVSRVAKKAKAIYPTLVRQPNERLQGIVEYVITGSRLKVLLPKDNALILVTLAGARAESASPAEIQAKGGKASPYAEEGRTFTRNLVHHHNIEFEVEGQDRTGAFRAHVFAKPTRTAEPVNLGVELLREGLATSIRTERYAEEYRKAEAQARDIRKRIWADYDPAKAEAEKKAREETVVAAVKPRKELVTVTEVLDGATFYFQVMGDEQKRLETLMADIKEKNYDSGEPYAPRTGEAVLAKFSGDGAWYRAKVGRVLPGANGAESKVEVLYADYGNAETVPTSLVRKLDPEYSPQALRWQAREASLAYVNPRNVDDEWGKEAALFFRELVWDKTLLATIEYKEGDREHLSLLISDEYTFVNAEILRAGLGKLPKRIPRGANKEIIEFLRSAQDEAFRAHAGIWEYGDDGEDDE